MKPEVIFKFLLKKATSLSAISVNYLSIYEEECFRGEGGRESGCEAPVFNHLFWKIYTSTFNFLLLVS